MTGDLLVLAGGAFALVMGGGAVVAPLRVQRARNACAADPVGWLRAQSGVPTNSADVRFIAARGWVGGSEFMTAPWIVVGVNKEVLVVESMVPWPVHGPKVVRPRESGGLRLSGRYVQDFEGTFALSTSRPADFAAMFRALGWIDPNM